MLNFYDVTCSYDTRVRKCKLYIDKGTTLNELAKKIGKKFNKKTSRIVSIIRYCSRMIHTDYGVETVNVNTTLDAYFRSDGYDGVEGFFKSSNVHIRVE